MRSDDLATLFQPAPRGAAQPMAYRQGIVIEFDPITLENVIRVDEVDLSNLPLLGIAEAVTLTPGDVVGLMVVSSPRGASTLGIMGQFVSPGSPEAATAISVPSINTYSVTTAAFETTSSAIWGDLATVGPVVSNVRIGPSGRCLVFITSTIVQLVTAGHGAMAYAISGATTVPTGDTPPELSCDGPVGHGQTATRLVLQEGLNAGLHTFTAKYSASDFGGGGSARFGGRNLTVMAL